jgi:hypothetical protein
MMKGFIKAHSNDGQPMNADDFQRAKLLSLLMFITTMQSAFWFESLLVPSTMGPCIPPVPMLPDDKAKQLMEGYLALMSAVAQFFPAPGDMESAVREMAVKLGIQIEVNMMAPSTKTPH